MIESTLTVFQKMILTFFVQKIAIKDIKQFGKVGGLLTKSERSRGKVDYPSKSGQSRRVQHFDELLHIFNNRTFPKNPDFWIVAQKFGLSSKIATHASPDF